MSVQFVIGPKIEDYNMAQKLMSSVYSVQVFGRTMA